MTKIIKPRETEHVIPATIEEAVSSLGALGKLLTATRWERSAIVFAFTREGTSGEGGPGRKQDAASRALLPGEFAKLGVTGLKDPMGIRRYRKMWMKGGTDQDLAPGSSYTLPEDPDGELWRTLLEEKDDQGNLSIPASGGRPHGNGVQDAAEIIENRGAAAVIEALKPAQRAALIAEATKPGVSWGPEEAARTVTRILDTSPETAKQVYSQPKIAKAVAAQPQVRQAVKAQETHEREERVAQRDKIQTQSDKYWENEGGNPIEALKEAFKKDDLVADIFKLRFALVRALGKVPGWMEQNALRTFDEEGSYGEYMMDLVDETRDAVNIACDGAKGVPDDLSGLTGSVENNKEAL